MRHSRTSSVLEQRAHAMRQAPTASEARLFEAVRGGKLGVSFRRQVPIAGRYIADLFASEMKLVVEIDGGYHAGRARADARRDRALARLGCHVLHIDAALVMGDLPAAVGRVSAEITRLGGAGVGERENQTTHHVVRSRTLMRPRRRPGRSEGWHGTPSRTR